MSNPQFEIAPGRWVGRDHPTFIIAEIGQNHQGDIEIAKKMIKLAKDAGADCAKFQKSTLDKKFTKGALARPYESKHSWGKTYGEHKRHLEFEREQYLELQRYANEIGIFFTASGMDEWAVDFLCDLNVPFLKVGSGDTDNLPYIEHIAKKGKPLVISTGMQSIETVRRVVSIVKPLRPNFALLQCTSAYPLPPEDVHLRVLETYQKEFPDVVVGYSGHESGIEITLGAVALGARVVERHITLDKTWKGNDHEASLDPSELVQLCSSIRILERALGTPHKAMRESEKACHDKLGKSVVTAVAVTKGEVITKEKLAVKVSYPKGEDPTRIYELVGKKVKRDIQDDEPITLADVE